MIITLGWHHGAGKSTLWKRLATHFGFKKYSTGDFMRDLALEKWISILDLNQMMEHDGWNIDRILDERQERLWNDEDNFIIDGRLAFHFIPHGKKIFLTVDATEAAKRIFHDQSRLWVEVHDTPEHAAENIILRRNSENDRYMKYYGVHIYDMDFYDIVVDTTHKTPEEVFEEVISKLKNV